MLHWEQLLTPIRFGQESYFNNNLSAHDSRNEFKRDYDRLIFSAPFRRMQNKTQVFPLPGSVFVHNRLTHSLEVSSVGSSLGSNVGNALREKYPNSAAHFEAIGSIVSAACLAHDMGNPPFGHSGEHAIGTYFSEGKGKEFMSQLTPEQWADCVKFEGNANTFRLLTHRFNGRRAGGFVLTYSTLASVVKYPFAAVNAPKAKFGFFDDDKKNWLTIAELLGLVPKADQQGVFPRFPLVYLVEAADDICYEIMDIEDAHKLRLLSTQETIDLFMNFFTPEQQERRRNIMANVTDVNERIAYLRSGVIGELIDACTKVFLENEVTILKGEFEGSLIKHIDTHKLAAYKLCAELSVERIYRSQEVLDIELAGYKIIYVLMEELIQAIFHPDKIYSKQLLQRIPQQYGVYSFNTYTRILAVLDYISSMTDVYALDLYQKITGMSLPAV